MTVADVGCGPEERRARAAWSRLAEPGDATAAQLVAALGPVAALDRLARLAAGAPVSVDGSVSVAAPVSVGAAVSVAPSVGRRGEERFLPRLAVLDVDRDLEVAAKFSARVVCPGDADWPVGLDDLGCPPFCLWVRGPLELGASLRRGVAVVGARAATAYGEMLAADIAAGLSERGFTVVSGAAFGIDAAAHRGVLAVGGPTVAVLAGGVERPYPSAHAALVARILEDGAVASEVPPGSAPTKSRFLQRNRLIATMTRGTVVVEAGLRSGSLNTARTAANHGRVVAVVPGPVTSMMSAGCHQAVRDGYAVLVTDAVEAADAVGEIGLDVSSHRSEPVDPLDRLPPEAGRVLGALPLHGASGGERLAVAAGLALAEVTAALGILELEGLVAREGAGWRRSRPSSAGLLSGR